MNKALPRELRLARRMARLGTETAFEVLVKARALEARDPRQSVATYLKVLRSDTPTHFAYFARHRLAQEPLWPRTAS